jgi:acyl dehydratase
MALHYEDVTVGDTFDCGTVSVSADEIIDFAEQFDPQPFHVDPDAARDSVFGGLVASGLHTLCLSFRLFVTEFVNPDDGLANLGGLGVDDLRWPNPVRPGDTLVVGTEVAACRPSESRDDRGYVDFDLHTLVDGEQVMSLRSHNIVARRD